MMATVQRAMAQRDTTTMVTGNDDYDNGNVVTGDDATGDVDDDDC
jgi:hypothetical protein